MAPRRDRNAVPDQGTSGSIPQVEAIKAFVANAPIAVAMTDRDMRFLKASPMWLADFAMSETEFLGRTSYELAPETEALYGPLHQRSLKGESVCSNPERVVLPNGQNRWMMWDAAPWRDDDGEVGGLLIISRDVTAQKQAEEELRRTRVFLATIVDNVPAPLVVKDEDGVVLMVNRAMEQMFGIAACDQIGRTVFDFIPPEEAEAIAREDAEALACGEPMVIEASRVHTGANETRIMRKTKVGIREEGGPSYLLAISEDITERRRDQEELERTRAFLSTILERVPIALNVKDASTGQTVISNSANERLLGVPKGSLIGKSAYDILPKEVADHFAAEDRKLLQNSEVHVAEIAQFQTPNNGVRSVRMMKTGLHSPDGQPYILTIAEDVTERRKTQDELESTRAFLATVIDAIPAGITVKDAADGRLLMINAAVEEIYGVVPKANLGKTGHEIFPREQAERFAQQDREVAAAGGIRVFDEERVWTHHGERFLRRKKVLIPNAEGHDYLLSISEDITDRKLAQDALKEALARAEAANVAKSEFLANMSHEIRTPLNGVLGLADALSRMDLTSRQLEIVTMIVSSGKALTGILSDVLDLAKAEAGQLQLQEEAFSLRETIGSAAFLFETVARAKGVDFRVEFEADGPDRLLGDPLRIKQVVSNLISNAVKFTSEGEVAVCARVHQVEDGAAELTVTVRDTGPGFSEEVRTKLFSRFEQGDGTITRRFGGTGLGLSIAGTLARMMGGDVSCSAVEGQGATFVFQGRMQIDRSTSVTAKAQEAGPGPAGELRLRVLLAEDHEVNQKVVQLMLGDIAELVIVSNGREAVEAFLAQGPFDVVLMDTQMPLMDGLTAIRHIRDGEARGGLTRTPIVSLTANAMAHQVKACLDAGADMHLAKPITSDGLYGAIDTALAQAPPAAETIARVG